MTSKPSVIIIGGGHNGLVCAAYLAKAGHSVQLLEARDVVGGGASTHEFSEGFKVSGLAHVMHPLNPKIVRDLGLGGVADVLGDGVDTIALDREGAHITLGRDEVSGTGLSDSDIKAYVEFKKEFRNFAAALEPMMMNKPPRLKDMDMKDKFTLAKFGWKLRFGLGVKSMREFLRVGGINIYDVLNEVFEDKRLKGALSADAVIGHFMGPRTPWSVLSYLHRLRGELYGAQSLPAGGMGAVAERLETAATGAGVKIRTGARVERVLVEEGRAVGVSLAGGETLDADIVVSNLDAKTTFLSMTGPENLDAMLVNRIHHSRTNGTTAKLHFALDGLPVFAGLPGDQLAQRLLIAPDMRYVEQAFNHAKYGEYSTAPVLEITIPSLSDPLLAPEGKHVMSVIASFAPYDLKEGWAEAKDTFADAVLGIIEQYAQGITGQVTAREVLTPADIEREYGITGGHWHHGELAIDQAFMMRPVHGTAQYDTPIEGLYLCGASAHPGGGITGTPGHNAAQRILSDKRISSRKEGA